MTEICRKPHPLVEEGRSIPQDVVDNTAGAGRKPVDKLQIRCVFVPRNPLKTRFFSDIIRFVRG